MLATVTLALFAVLLGAAFCFAGYRFFLVMLPIWGFFGGFYIVGVLIIAGAFGGALGSGVMGALGFDPGLITAIVALVSALIAAGLTLLLNLQKYVIIVFTAMAGAVLIAFSSMLLFGQITVAELQTGRNLIQPVFQGSWFWSIVWLVLTIIGTVVQIRANRTYAFTREMYVEGWH
jgi:hypothetical protein